MEENHKGMIREYFEAGEENKSLKKSPALMLEAMKMEIGEYRKNPNQMRNHPKQKHYLPFVS